MPTASAMPGQYRRTRGGSLCADNSRRHYRIARRLSKAYTLYYRS